MTRHPALIDLTGQRFGRCEVLGVSPRRGHDVFWTLRCDCGEVFENRGRSLRTVGLHYCCPKCRPRSGSARTRNCQVCHQSGHTRQNCPERESAPSKFCGQCYDIPDRRPRVGACQCGRSFAPDVVTLDEQFALPVESRRSA